MFLNNGGATVFIKSSFGSVRFYDVSVHGKGSFGSLLVFLLAKVVEVFNIPNKKPKTDKQEYYHYQNNRVTGFNFLQVHQECQPANGCVHENKKCQ